MKTTIIKYMTFIILLLLTIGIAGCEDESNVLSTIQPISNIDDEIITFFENELPAMETSNSFFTDVAKETEICYVVNDKKDFQNLYKGTLTLPTQ